MPTDAALERLIALHRPKPKPRRHDETTLNGKLIDAAPKYRAKLFRNNRGAVKKGEHWIAYGVGPKGASDLIGWRELTITQSMVGKTVAQFLAIESKADTGRATSQQIDFVLKVQAAGGVAQVVKSEAEFEELMRTR